MPEYVAHASTVGGRNGHVETSDGLLQADLSIPQSIGGPGKPGASNPEQFFAAGIPPASAVRSNTRLFREK